MDMRRATWEAAIRVAVALSAIAAVLSLVASAAGFARPAIVLAVIFVGFSWSWVRTGQVSRSFSSAHRVTIVARVHQPLG